MHLKLLLLWCLLFSFCFSADLYVNFYSHGCGGRSYFGTVYGEYGVCFANRIFDAPNCSDYIACAAGNPTLLQFSNCLTQPPFFYIIMQPFNDTMFRSFLYLDVNCTVPYEDVPFAYVPTGCQPGFYTDVAGPCGFKTITYLISAATTLSSYFF